jgi:hypothetical protein
MLFIYSLLLITALTIGALISLPNTSPITLLILLPTLGQLVWQLVIKFYSLKYAPQPLGSLVTDRHAKYAQSPLKLVNLPAQHLTLHINKSFLLTLGLFTLAVTATIAHKFIK